MKVGIDAGPLLGEGGISRYVAPLVRSLVAEDDGTDYHLILRRSWLKHPKAVTLDGLIQMHMATDHPVHVRILLEHAHEFLAVAQAHGIHPGQAQRPGMVV